MDRCSGKRNQSGTVVPRRACSLAMRDNTDTKDQNAQFCNRIGCSGRLKYRSGPVDSAEKAKYSRPSINSSHGKKVGGSSSRICFPISRERNSTQDSPRKFSSNLESLQPKSRCVQDESKVKPSRSRCRNYQVQLLPKMRASCSRFVIPAEEGSLCTGLIDSSKRVPRHKPQSGSHSVPSGSSISATNSGISRTRNSISGSCNGLRSLTSYSLSDAIRHGSSSSESRNVRDLLKEGLPVGESSSSSRIKKESVASSRGQHILPSTSCTSISCSRRNRNGVSTHGNIGSSVQTRRSVNANSRIVCSNRESVTSFSVSEFQSNIPETTNFEVCDNAHHASSSRSSLAASLVASSCHTTTEQDCDNVPRMATLTSAEHGGAQGFRWHHLNGAAEVLFVLERIEQDEELTYEHLLLLENNSFFGSVYFYDQHRDMRLDIDNMSYEELLALGERIGSVSTALSDEAFAKCVKRTIYQATSLEVKVAGCGEDEADVKCSICQEEYGIGDEIGTLGCEHGYHVECLQQWLRRKNWCPICKASAAAP